MGSRRTCLPPLLGAVIALLTAVVAGPALAADATVRIHNGPVTGSVEDGVSVFKGIPFAAPPVGPLRWRAPQPPSNWTAPLAAHDFGPGCPQPKRRSVAPAGVERFSPATQSEDCLTLNVWSPGRRGDKLPVMVWIHGGAFRVGGSSLPYFDGQAFARQGVILVSFNYRLGRLGFFAHPLIVDSAHGEPVGNYGVMDQLAALRWVKQNIAAFGGDPANVTVFGESAGGSSLLFLLTSPAAAGLFQKAIVESGGGWQAAAPLARQEASDAAAVTRALGHAPASAEELRAMSADQLLDIPGDLRFGPFIDGSVVRESPRSAIAAGRISDMPIIIGTNSDEATPLMTTFGSSAQRVLGLLDARGQAVYRDDGATPDETARRVYTDASFLAPARWVARMTAAGAPTWLYHFTYVPAAQRKPGVGASHGSEVPFVFDSWRDIPSAQSFLQPADAAEGRLMNRCWASFAKSGVPSDCGATWPRYDPAKDQWLVFGDSPAVQAGFRKPMLDWQEQRVGR